jgi:hypothetical protein
MAAATHSSRIPNSTLLLRHIVRLHRASPQARQAGSHGRGYLFGNLLMGQGSHLPSDVIDTLYASSLTKRITLAKKILNMKISTYFLSGNKLEQRMREGTYGPPLTTIMLRLLYYI